MAALRNHRTFHALTAFVVLLLTTGAAPPARAPGPEPARSYAPTLDPRSGRPGDPVQVSFPQGVSISTCRAGFVRPLQSCKGLTALVSVPTTSPATITLMWEVTPEYGAGLPWPKEGSLEFQVPEPAFTVTANREEGSPGDRVIVSFSGPPATKIRGCSVTIGDAVGGCKFDEGWATEVVVPSSGGDLAWTVHYDEEKIPASGTIPFRIVPTSTSPSSETGPPSLPEFRVSAEQASAEPGEPVTVHFEPLTDGITITGCTASFVEPVACDDRRMAILRVPATARPGTNVIVWTLSYAGDGKDERSGTLAFPVTPVTVPKFVVSVEPSQARAGQRVTVTFVSLAPGVDIVGCLAAFAQEAGAECRPAQGRWSARIIVPRVARPGSTLLRWGVGSRDARGREGTDNGIIDYQVVGPPAAPEPATPRSTSETPSSRTPGPVIALPPTGSTAPEEGPARAGAAFSVLPDPAAARVGDRVTVSLSSLVDGVTITGCSAGFTPAAMAPCRPNGQDWAAEVVVPESAPVGQGTLRWQLAYQGAGQSDLGDTDGLLTFAVLAAKATTAGWASKLFGIGGRVLLGALLLGALLAGPALRGRLRRWRDQRRPATTDDEPPAGLPKVVAMPHAERMAVDVTEPAGGPEHLIRITTRAPRAEPVVHEEVP